MNAHVESIETRTPQFSWKGYFTAIFVATFVILVFALIGILIEESPQARQARTDPAQALGIGMALIIFGIIAGSFTYIPILLARKAFASQSAKDAKIEIISKTSEELQGTLERDFVTNLVRINFKYIDAYYLQTKIQADKSFNFTLASASVSLVLILIDIILSFWGRTDAATVSAVAGVLGEFISAVFFYLYNQTIAKMAEYHRKLVFTQNIGLALKISDGLPVEEKTKAQVALIDTLSKDINQYLGG